jgi:hypothetical protein
LMKPNDPEPAPDIADLIEAHVKQCLCFVLDKTINCIPFAVVGGRRDPAGPGKPTRQLRRVLINRDCSAIAGRATDV